VWRERQHLWILIAITALGIGLRCFNLACKPLWTDEFATLVFGLGHSFETIPLDQVITAEVLLQPLVPDPGLHLGGVIRHLLGESNHPPLYFLLTHLWLQLFPTSEGLVSLWGARSLSALLGAASVPAIFGLGYLAFRSVWIAQLSALLMATSPLGIYLAQEARHYTLPILWAIASLACLIIATRALVNCHRLPIWVVFAWIAVNGLGMASHYFFGLTIGAEGLVIAGMGRHQLHGRRSSWANAAALKPKETALLTSTWLRIGVVALGTVTSMAVWLPFLEGVQDSEITQWIYKGDRAGLEWLDPVFQMLAGMITMLYMLPIQANPNPIRVVSYAGLVIIAIWTGFKVSQGFRLLGTQHSSQILGGFVGGAIALFLIITYGFEREVTSAPRYHFVFFPALLILVAAALVALWHQKSARTTIIITSLSLIGAICVATNLGYQKVHRPEVVAQAIREAATRPSLVAIVHQTHGQTGRMMGIAWDLHNHPSSKESEVLYLMAQAHETLESALIPLEQALAQNSAPLNLWLLNFKGLDEQRLQDVLAQHYCQLMPTVQSAIDGYRYQLHTCNVSNAS
jgi:uncharacterized membrane protein